MRRRWKLLPLWLVLAGGCQSGADELMRTAKFEELQRNPEHARELYQRVLADYPDSPQASEARERLAQLQAAPPP